MTDYSDASVLVTDLGDSKGDATCGTRSYYIKESGFDWVQVSGSSVEKDQPVTITAQPRNVANGEISLTLVVSSAFYADS